MKVVGIIPARHASTRFPGKPLALIAGVPMIQRVWERARQSKHLRDVWIATDDARIAEVCEDFGARCVMTSSDHPTGSDRLAEVAAGLDDDIVVNIQADEPLIESRVVDATVEALMQDPGTPMATAVHRADPEILGDPNCVKVVLDRSQYALYFSRSAIPHPRGTAAEPAPWQHIGVYAYQREFLLEFARLPRTPAEESEQLEQLRALEHGHRIRAAVIESWQSIGVDLPEDVKRVERLLERG